MPVWKVAVRAPYGTSFGSVAASPPATPLTVPIKPPKAMAERGLSRPTVPTAQVDLRNGEQFTPGFRALNPDCMVPVLELDSGAAITDIIAICRYFEELHPDPPLMGRDAEERAVIESWLRRIEWDGIYAAQEAFRNSTPGLKGRALPPRTDSGARGARASSASAFLCMARCTLGRQ
jgi:glutathione S-transferase